MTKELNWDILMFVFRKKETDIYKLELETKVSLKEIKEVIADSEWFDYNYDTGIVKLTEGAIALVEAYKKDNKEEGIIAEKIIWDRDLSDYEADETAWIIDKYLPERAIVFFGGKRSSYKTWLALSMAISISSGTKFLGFDTIKSQVLFVDEENGTLELRDRVEAIKKGLDLNEDLDIAYLSFAGMKIENNLWREALEQFLERHKTKVVIVDSIRRILSCDENDATNMNSVFTEIIRPITEKYGITWIFLHHLRKGMGRDVSDPLDEFRGSSELVNYSDVVLMVKRRGIEHKFIFSQPKTRRKIEQKPIMVNVESEDGAIMFENMGSAEEMVNKDELCKKDLLVWLEEDNIKTFRTMEAIESMELRGHAKRTISRALSILKASGELESHKKGYYNRITFGANSENSRSEKSPLGASLAPSVRTRQTDLAQTLEVETDSKDTITEES